MAANPERASIATIQIYQGDAALVATQVKSAGTPVDVTGGTILGNFIAQGGGEKVLATDKSVGSGITIVDTAGNITLLIAANDLRVPGLYTYTIRVSAVAALEPGVVASGQVQVLPAAV